jgi:hypothetical protein
MTNPDSRFSYSGASTPQGEAPPVQHTSNPEPVANYYGDRIPVTNRPEQTYARSVVHIGGPGGAEYARRITVFAAGIVQSLIVLRIVLLLLDARGSNALVATVLNVSQIFVAPFEGVLHTNALGSGGSILDVAAVVALIGWTLVEAVTIAGIAIFRREPSLA